VATRRRRAATAGDPGGPGATSVAGGRGSPGGARGSGSVLSAASDAGYPGEADPEADAEAVARLICLRMLTVAPRTRAQLATALRQRGVREEVAEAVLGRFAEVKLIDDATFASAWVESRHHGRGLSGRALAAELRDRGVDSGDIQAAVGRLDPEQEVATARALVASRLAATRGQPAPTRVRRLIGVLARKGYSPALAYRLVREALEQEGVDLAAAGLDLTDAPDEPPEEAPDGPPPEP
jgi:regulatory protein